MASKHQHHSPDPLSLKGYFEHLGLTALIVIVTIVIPMSLMSVNRSYSLVTTRVSGRTAAYVADNIFSYSALGATVVEIIWSIISIVFTIRDHGDAKLRRRHIKMMVASVVNVIVVWLAVTVLQFGYR